MRGCQKYLGGKVLCPLIAGFLPADPVPAFGRREASRWKIRID